MTVKGRAYCSKTVSIAYKVKGWCLDVYGLVIIYFVLCYSLFWGKSSNMYAYACCWNYFTRLHVNKTHQRYEFTKELLILRRVTIDFPQAVLSIRRQRSQQSASRTFTVFISLINWNKHFVFYFLYNRTTEYSKSNVLKSKSFAIEYLPTNIIV